ncbi:MAG: gliding motility-associated C-terminal domain-containing protein [Bacteroidales bacterium]|jgi:gliding motility-associated-like protein|nr:gliding motility-associated C-terminal domain-containing protein [Bacteroidales bacterium]
MKKILLINIIFILISSCISPIFSQVFNCFQTYHPSDDLWVHYVTNGGPNSDNYPATRYLHTSIWTFNGYPGITRSFVKFDLDGISNINNTRINNITLNLYNSGCLGDFYHSSNRGNNPPNQVIFYRITSDWTETSVSWNAQPNVDDSFGVVSLAFAGTLQDPSTEDVSVELNDILLNNGEIVPNYGIAWRCNQEDISSRYRGAVFASKDHEDPTYWPKLEVEYEFPQPEISFISPNTFMVTNNEDIEEIFDNIIYEWTINGNTYYGNSFQYSDLCSNGILNLRTIITNNSGTICEQTVSTTINGVGTFDVFSNIRNVTCNGSSDGEITTIVSGGTSPYTYLWNDGIQTSSRTGLSAGTYVVTITDNNNCTRIENFTVSTPAPFNITTDISNMNCYGDTAVVILEIYGNTPPYNISWNNGQTGNIFTTTSPGNYPVTISDINNCPVNITITINPSPPRLEINSSVQNAICEGNNNGIISTTVTGGVEPYFLSWNNGSHNSIITNLYAGNYSLTVTDANGCKSQKNFEVTESKIIITPTINNETCHENNGSIHLDISGSNPPFSILWDDNSSENFRTGLLSGIYSVTITDTENCEKVQTYRISNNGPIIETQINNINCKGGQNGSISISNITGGTPPYSINWSNNSNDYNITNLSAGAYQLTISDINNCTHTYTYLITEPAEALIADILTNNTSCHNTKNGVIYIIASGGNTPYTYYVSNLSNSYSTSYIENLASGEYICRIRDNNNCIIIDTIKIEHPSELTANISLTDPSCIGKNDGKIELFVNGGTSPYFFEVGEIIYTDTIITGLREGYYSVGIYDNNNCKYFIDPIKLTDQFVECIKIPDAFSPNGDGINDTWIIEGIEDYPEATIQIFNRWGQIITYFKISEGFWNGKYKGKNVPTGSYIYILDLISTEDKYTGTVTVVY